jgi:glycosyltransferase involved in cell wall biosynthesis
MKRELRVGAGEQMGDTRPALLFPMDRPPEVSVVVPTYRRPQLVARCLVALAAQTQSPRTYEIIVCDDGCDPLTHDVVAAFAQRMQERGLRVVYIAVTGTQGPAGARNRGWRRARAPVVAFTDDDTVPDRHWLAAGLRAMRTGLSAAAGRIQVPLPDAPTDYELDAAGLASSEFATANCFVHRDMLELVGGFDERYTSAWREDSDLQFSILCAGGTVGAAKDALVLHPVRPARWGVSIAQQRKSQFDALLHKKFRKLYRSHVAAGPPLHYYGIVASVLASGTAIFAGWPIVATAGGVLWLALTGAFVRRRLQRTARTPAHVAEMVATSLVIPFLSGVWRIVGAVRFRTMFV